jgi:ABC-2 type transport system ATP-binding protein
MSTPAIELEGVRKRFRYFTLDDLTLELEQGQILGLVGPNGAGKTTTIRLIMGMSRPDAGRIRVLGHDLPQAQAQAKLDVGFVAHDMSPFASATLGWHMGFVKSIYPTWDDAYAKLLLKRMHLRQEQPCGQLSSGERLKAMLLLALARRPRLLVLDEPTEGLDPVARHEVLAELMEVLKDEQRSILFSSHNTLDVEQISDRICFIDRGRVVDCDDKESFLERWRRLTLELPAEGSLPTLPGVSSTQRQGRTAVVTTRAWSEGLQALYRQSGASIRDVQRMTLEEIFVASVLERRQERGE